MRSFPHVDGDFATHVFLPVSVPGGRALLARRLATSIARVPSSRRPRRADAAGRGRFDLIPRDAHVSLSRVFATRANQREGVLASLRRALAAAEAFDVDVGPAFRVFVNDERTATFLALEVRERGGGDRTSPGVTTQEASDGDGGDARDGGDGAGDGDGDVVSVSSFAGLVRAVDAALAPGGVSPVYADPAPRLCVVGARGRSRGGGRGDRAGASERSGSESRGRGGRVVDRARGPRGVQSVRVPGVHGVGSPARGKPPVRRGVAVMRRRMTSGASVDFMPAFGA